MFGYLSGADFEPRCGVLVRFVKKTIQGYETDRYQSGQRLGAPAILAKHVASLHSALLTFRYSAPAETPHTVIFGLVWHGAALVWRWCGSGAALNATPLPH